MTSTFDSDRDPDYSTLDPGVREAVRLLREAGIETFESCEGGEGHAYAEPTVRFHGQRDQGWKALHVALERGLRVGQVARIWPIIDGEPTGPYWEVVLRRPRPPVE